MVTGTVRGWLRGEGALVLAACMLAYTRGGGRWWLFLACFLLPDVALLGYWAGSRVGAHVYNAVHSYAGPVLLACLSLGRFRWGVAAASIWAAHIGFDRMLGYGLKYETGFVQTHLGRIGRQPAGWEQ